MQKENPIIITGKFNVWYARRNKGFLASVPGGLLTVQLEKTGNCDDSDVKIYTKVEDVTGDIPVVLSETCKNIVYVATNYEVAYTWNLLRSLFLKEQREKLFAAIHNICMGASGYLSYIFSRPIILNYAGYIKEDIINGSNLVLLAMNTNANDISITMPVTSSIEESELIELDTQIMTHFDVVNCLNRAAGFDKWYDALQHEYK